MKARRLVCLLVLAPAPAFAGPPDPPTTEDANRLVSIADASKPGAGGSEIDLDHPLEIELSGLQRVEVELWTCAGRSDPCRATTDELQHITAWRTDVSDPAEGGSVRIEIHPTSVSPGVVSVSAPPGPGARITLSPDSDRTFWARVRTTEPRDRAFADERTSRAVHDALASGEMSESMLPVSAARLDSLNIDLAFFDALADWLIANGEDRRAARALAQAAASQRIDAERDRQSTALIRRRRPALDRKLDDVVITGRTGASSTYKKVDAGTKISVVGPAVVDLRIRAMGSDLSLTQDRVPPALVRISSKSGIDETIALSTTAAPDIEASAEGRTRAAGLLSTQRIVVPPGRHAIELVPDAEIAVDATVRARRYRLGESLSGRTGTAELARGNRRAKTTVGRQWASALKWSPSPTSSTQGFERLLGLTLRADTSPTELGVAAEIASTLDVDSLDAKLARGIAQRLAHLSQDEAVDRASRTAAAAAIARLDPDGQLSDGLVVRAQAVPLDRRAKRSRALALATAASRRAPDRPEVRRAAQRVYWRASQWSTLAPLEDPAKPLTIERILVRRADAPDDVDKQGPQTETASLRNLWTLPVDGTPVRMVAPASPLFPGRASVVTLRLHFGSAPQAHDAHALDGRYSLSIDGTTRHGIALANYERLVVALAPGPHHISLQAAGATAFTNVAPTGDDGQPPSDGRFESTIALGRDDSVDYALPPGGHGLARLALRLPGPGKARLRIVLESGDGSPADSRVVEVTHDGRDANVFPLSPQLEVSPRKTVVVALAHHHSRVRVVALDGEALVTMAVRRDTTPPPPQDAGPQSDSDAETTDTGAVASADTPPAREASPREPALEAIGRLSRTLHDDPSNVAAYLERGHRLLDLEEYGLARVDLERALALDPSAQDDPIARSLAEGIDQRNDPRHLDVPVPEAGGRVLSPAFVDLGETAEDYRPLVDVAAKARTKGPAAALDGIDPDSGVLAAAVAAELAARAGAPRVAARTGLQAYDSSGHWPLAYAAAADYLRVLDLDDGYRDAGVAYGLAQRLRDESDTGRIRSLRVRAGRLSAWKRISASHNSAGFERIIESQRIEPSESQALGLALLSPQWPHEDATYLWPGRRSVIRERIAGDRSLSLQAHCQDLRAPKPAHKPIRLELRVDGDLRDVEVSPSTAAVPFHAIDLPLVAGEHRVEIALPSSEQGVRCSVRAQHDEETPRRATTRRWLTARPSRPFEVDLGGPVSVRVSLRRFDHDPDRAEPTLARLELFAFDARGQATDQALVTREVELGPQADDAAAPERSRPGAVGPQIEETFLVTAARPGRLRVTVPDDAVLVRVSLRQADAQGAAAEADGTIEVADLNADDPGQIGADEFTVPPVPIGPIVGRDLEHRETRFGTVTSDNRVGLDEIGDADLFEPRVISTHHLDYRRELAPSRLWLRLGPTARIRQGSGTAGGGRLSVRANFPRSRLRLGASGEALVQGYDGATAYSIRGTAFVDRPTELTPRLELRPAVYFDARTQSLDPAAITEIEPQPRVYLRFVEDHPLVLRPELALRYLPLQDLVLAVTARAPLNSDFASLDRFDAQADLWAVASNMRRVLPEFSLGYQASVRLADNHRSQTYLRHRASASIGMGVWAKQAVRVSFGVQDSLFFAQPFGLRNVASLYLRLDFAFGRGLRDYGPREMLFRQLKEQRDFVALEREDVSQ